MDVLRNAGSIEMHLLQQDREKELMPEEKIFNFLLDYLLKKIVIVWFILYPIQLTPQLSVHPGFGSDVLPPTVNIFKN